MNKEGENNLPRVAGQTLESRKAEGATALSPDYINKIEDVINNLRYSYNDILFIAMDILKEGKAREAYELTGQAQAIVDLMNNLTHVIKNLKSGGKNNED